MQINSVQDAFEAGRKYAEQENAALAGVAPDPKHPILDVCFWRSFVDGYDAFNEETACDANRSPQAA